ncbi:hypothetical protein J2X86_002435 [Acinetobacter lwoffii]|jgi:hypothetical protein|uniref:Uncharacterized protein n=1 Tax=Acinetobacter lwoffii TaxID=28090 RepID=A0AAW8LKN5_ACILW|nr:hypothetical protein [Acinetobacter lwoffii]MDR6630380.1 hypothetical protein [Acinetobacter lwoffii]
MSFKLGKFDENILIGKIPQIPELKIKDLSAEFGTKQMRLKRHFGHAADEFQQLYVELHDLGQILNCNYFVKFQAYRNNATKGLPIVSQANCRYLVTETNLPIIQAEFEQVKAGPFQISHLTGMTEPDLQLTFLETAQAWICNSMLAWGQLMVNEDGTVNPPASYAVRMTVGLFSKDLGLDFKPVERTWIVAPNLASIDALSANGVSELAYVPATFTVLRNFME